MDRIAKRDTIIICILLTGAVLGLRWQLWIVSGIGLIGLVATTAFTKRSCAFLATAAGFIFLYPAPQIGWIYRRGSHVGVNTTETIASLGWPLSSFSLGRGFPETPLLHFHGIILKSITSLNIRPGPEPEVLISWIIPLAYALTTIAVVTITARRYISSLDPQIEQPSFALLMLPVLLWIPFYRTKTGFTRQSLAIVIFALSVYAIYRIYYSSSFRFMLIGVIAGIAMVSSHHLTSFVLITLLTTILSLFFFKLKIQNRSVLELFSGLRGRLASLFLAIGALFVAWQYLFSQGGETFVSLLLGISLSAGKMETLVTILLGGGAPEQATLPLVQRGMLIRFQSFFSLWIYQGLLALGVLAFLYKYRQNIDSDDWSLIILLFGVMIAGLSVLSWILAIGSVERIMTFFVLVGGWLAPMGIHGLFKRTSEYKRKVTAGFVIVVAIIGLSMIPPYVMTDVQPRYDQGETDQRFPSQHYAAGMFVEKHTLDTTPIIGDENIEHILIATAGRQAINPPDPVLEGKIPKGSIGLLVNYNNQVFIGSHPSVGRYIMSPGNVRKGFMLRNQTVYTNGDAILIT